MDASGLPRKNLLLTQQRAGAREWMKGVGRGSLHMFWGHHRQRKSVSSTMAPGNVRFIFVICVDCLEASYEIFLFILNYFHGKFSVHSFNLQGSLLFYTPSKKSWSPFNVLEFLFRPLIDWSVDTRSHWHTFGILQRGDQGSKNKKHVSIEWACAKTQKLFLVDPYFLRNIQ